MNQALHTLLDDIRSTYLDLVRARIDDARNLLQRVLMEPSLRNSSGELVCEGKFGLPMRIDMFILNDGPTGGSARVDSEKILEFSPLSVQWNNRLDVVIAPFCWDSCFVWLKGSILENDVHAIVAWFTEWFDPDDQNPSDGNGLHGVVHFLSDPEVSESSASFEIDFGSSGTEAFIRLLDVISSLGVSKVSIGKSIGSA